MPETEIEEEEDVKKSKTPAVVVGRSRSQSAGRRVSPHAPPETEKHLPNGDLYIGSFSGSVPHGSGKYLWKDGCMYQGEWKKGKASGKGKFSWPSGATFEGEFKSGRMEGFGTFTGSDGDTYRGSWVSDRKHGYGQKRYSNGDCYEGTWRKNLQDGRGRYVWRNGNEYVGDWKSGVISGRGILIWANGNKFDGHWENGVPKGYGVFTWPDGSCYVGTWDNNGGVRGPALPQQQVLDGTFYPANHSSKNLEEKMGFNQRISAPLVAEDLIGKKSSSLDEGRCNLPRICIWESDGDAGDITCEILDCVEAASMSCSNSTSFDEREVSGCTRNPCCYTGEVKKPGQMISKGHKNYDLMLNLQLGIRYSTGKHASLKRDLKTSDFDPKEKFWTRFPPEGSKLTPPHQSADFRWKDYCPVVFRHLREIFQVDPADYMLAICGNDALRELSSPGKSGSLFYLTQDDRFMIKTVKKSEVKVLLKMLPSYYQHFRHYENSLVTRFFGVHCVKPVGGLKTRFIVMGNLFCSDHPIHRRFDLKGSSYGRTTDKAEADIDETTTLKDLDLDFVFRLQKHWSQELVKQIYKDCKFLEAEKIMDYSLLVGLHFRDDTAGDKVGQSPSISRDAENNTYRKGKSTRGYHFLEAEPQEKDPVSAGRKSMIRLGANMPARAERSSRVSDQDQRIPAGFTNVTPSGNVETYEVILYFGIIDILQDYDIIKKLEHAYKSLQADPTSISAVDPKLYSKRFREFVGRTFVEDK